MLRKNRLSLIFLISIILFFSVLSSFITGSDNLNEFETGFMTDIDGNVYETIKIGNQEWMIENLKVTEYRNGDPIPNVKGKDKWQLLQTGAYCDYKNNAKFSSEYGKLYNWYAVNDERGIAPEGWHIPTVEEWEIMIDFLGGKDFAGGKLKETGTFRWDKPNSDASNLSGFSALPGGVRYLTGKYYSKGLGGYWWTSSENESGLAVVYHLYYFFGTIYKYDRHKELGISIRCIKD